MLLAAEDSSTSISGKGILMVLAVAVILLWAGSKGGRGR